MLHIYIYIYTYIYIYIYIYDISNLRINQINWDGEPSGYAENPENWGFSLKIGFIASLKWETISTKGCLGYMFIYLQIKH